RVGLALADSRACKLGEMFVVRDADPTAFENFPIARRSDEADRLADRKQRRDPRLAAGRDEVVGFVGQSDPGELPLDGFFRTWCIGDQGDAASFVAPLA